MRLDHILGNLLADVDRAVGVTLIDDAGEAIETVSAELDAEEMRAVGALAEIHLRKLRSSLTSDEDTTVGALLIEGENLDLLAQPVGSGYVLALALRTPALTTPAATALERAGLEIERAILS